MASTHKPKWDLAHKLLNRYQFFWIRPEDVGGAVQVPFPNQSLSVRIPEAVSPGTTLRVNGRGWRLLWWQGDLYLRLLSTRGPDRHGALWLERRQAADGTVSKWGSDPTLQIRVPEGCREGEILRLSEQGFSPKKPWRAQRVDVTRGDLLLKIRLYDALVSPPPSDVEGLGLDELVAENWVFRQMDRIRECLGSKIPVRELEATAVAEEFNHKGWTGVATLVRRHLGLINSTIRFMEDSNLKNPGQCETKVMSGMSSGRYCIKIKSEFLDSPFAIAAILAHECCHVVDFEWLTPNLTERLKTKRSAQDVIEDERTVDLLVFMLGLGQFQIRVASMNRLTLGYFNQKNFNRMLRIAQRRTV